MSYDLYLKDPVTNEVCKLDKPHHLKGGTYAVDGLDTAEFNITYNYSGIFQELFGEEGIRSIYGLTGQKSIAILVRAILKLKDDPCEISYWEATSGNAKIALESLLELAVQCPTKIWDGD